MQNELDRGSERACHINKNGSFSAQDLLWIGEFWVSVIGSIRLNASGSSHPQFNPIHTPRLTDQVASQRQSREWHTVCNALPLPTKRTLRSHFAAIGTVLSDALVDLSQVGTLIDRYNHSHPDIQTDRRVVLSVDAVAFRPRVTLSSERDVLSICFRTS
jgi:hypothetical protein